MQAMVAEAMAAMVEGVVAEATEGAATTEEVAMMAMVAVVEATAVGAGVTGIESSIWWHIRHLLACQSWQFINLNVREERKEKG